MMTVHETHMETRSVSKNYQKLLDRFEGFCQSATAMPEHRENPMLGLIVFEPSRDKHRIRARWAGRVLEFRFSVVKPEGDATKGRITCVEISPTEDQCLPLEIDAFSFNQEGTLDIECPKDVEDEMDIQATSTSWYLVGRCFLKAIRT